MKSLLFALIFFVCNTCACAQDETEMEPVFIFVDEKKEILLPETKQANEMDDVSKLELLGTLDLTNTEAQS